MTPPTENGHARQNLLSFHVLRQTEPRAPPLRGASTDFLQNWDSI